MKQEEIVKILKDTGTMLEGHFLLTSGRHSNRYMQCARLFEFPQYSEALCKHLAGQMKDLQVDLVISPAIGGIIMGYEMARQLGIKNIFAERENGVMTLRRNFEIPVGARVLAVEDVVTTGGSVMEVIELVRQMGGNPVAVGMIVDRSAGQVKFDIPAYSCYSAEITSYHPEECPICATGQPLVKPGSRNFNK